MPFNKKQPEVRAEEKKEERLVTIGESLGDVRPVTLRLSTIDAYLGSGAVARLYLRGGHELEVGCSSSTLRSVLSEAGFTQHVECGHPERYGSTKAWIDLKVVDAYTEVPVWSTHLGAESAHTKLFLTGGRSITLERLSAEEFAQQLSGEAVSLRKIFGLLVRPGNLVLSQQEVKELSCVARQEGGDDGHIPQVEWVSTRPAVASVVNGVVTAHREGTAEIIARFGKFTDSCTVIVPHPSPAKWRSVLGISPATT